MLLAPQNLWKDFPIIGIPLADIYATSFNKSSYLCLSNSRSSGLDEDMFQYLIYIQYTLAVSPSLGGSRQHKETTVYMG